MITGQVVSSTLKNIFQCGILSLERGGEPMLELTKEECLELEKRVTEKIHQSFPEETQDGNQRLYEIICRMASRATIMTIREYERLQAAKQDPS